MPFWDLLVEGDLLFELDIRGYRKKERELKTRPDTRPIPVAGGKAGAEMRVFTLSNSITTD